MTDVKKIKTSCSEPSSEAFINCTSSSIYYYCHVWRIFLYDRKRDVHGMAYLPPLHNFCQISFHKTSYEYHDTKRTLHFHFQQYCTGSTEWGVTNERKLPKCAKKKTLLL